MKPARISPLWMWSGTGVLALHGAVLAALALAGARMPQLPLPEPEITIELPPLSTTAPRVDAEPDAPRPQLLAPTPLAPRIFAPPVNAPLPPDAVAAPPPQPASPTTPQGAAASPPPAQQTAPQRNTGPHNSDNTHTPGNNPQAAQQEADYRSLVIGFVRRSGFRPVRSLRSGIGGSVDVQFTVDRQTAISRVSVVRSSGNAVLDSEAAEHVRQLGRIPQFPRDLARDEVTMIATLRFRPERR